MSISGIILGLINIVIVVVLLLLIGAVAAWVLAKIGWPIDGQIRQLFIALVALIALYMVVALLFGLPSVTILRM